MGLEHKPTILRTRSTESTLRNDTCGIVHFTMPAVQGSLCAILSGAGTECTLQESRVVTRLERLSVISSILDAIPRFEIQSRR